MSFTFDYLADLMAIHNVTAIYWSTSLRIMKVKATPLGFGTKSLCFIQLSQRTARSNVVSDTSVSVCVCVCMKHADMK